MERRPSRRSRARALAGSRPNLRTNVFAAFVLEVTLLFERERAAVAGASMNGLVRTAHDTRLRIVRPSRRKRAVKSARERDGRSVGAASVGIQRDRRRERAVRILNR